MKVNEDIKVIEKYNQVIEHVGIHILHAGENLLHRKIRSNKFHCLCMSFTGNHEYTIQIPPTLFFFMCKEKYIRGKLVVDRALVTGHVKPLSIVAFAGDSIIEIRVFISDLY